VRRKTASTFGLVAFAVMAVIGALGSVEFGAALGRAIAAAVVMSLVGYVAGHIAEMALQEAVDSRMPLHPEPTIEDLKSETASKKEGTK
jgi:flagellar motor component MotA